MASKIIYIYAHWENLPDPTLMGVLRTEQVRGKEIFSFEYERIVFSICIKNTDDHLRNHGFLLSKYGWRLSPAYDINPSPTGTGLTLNISDEDNSLSLDLAKEVAVFFRIETKRANEIIKTCTNAVKDWRKVALKYGLTRNEMDLMSAAFEH
jgi:serine/threonine-protein kinase HipA